MTAARPSEIVVVDGRAYHIGLAAHELAPRLFLVGDPARAHRVAERFDRVDHRVTHREFITLTGTYDGMPVSVMGTGIGTDNVEIALVEAFTLRAFDLASGLRVSGREPLTVIRVGTSGGAREDIAAGTLAISRYAIGLDSTGLYYDPPAEDDVVEALERAAKAALDGAMRPGARFSGRIHPYAARGSGEVTAALAQAAASRGVAHEVGVTVAVPGFYGASGRFIEGLRNSVPDIKAALARVACGRDRVINFEMESSLLFLLAAQMGYRAGTICPIISNPASHGEVIDYRPRVEDAIDIALDAMVALTARHPG